MGRAVFVEPLLVDRERRCCTGAIQLLRLGDARKAGGQDQCNEDSYHKGALKRTTRVKTSRKTKTRSSGGPAAQPDARAVAAGSDTSPLVCGRGTKGKVKWKAEPEPSSLSAQMRPP